MYINVTINKEDLQKLIHADVARQLGDVKFDHRKIKIEVKSKQNYKSEWEEADFRAICNINT